MEQKRDAPLGHLRRLKSGAKILNIATPAAIILYTLINYVMTATINKKSTHGGRRKGSGRKKKEPTKTLSYRVPLDKSDKIDKEFSKAIKQIFPAECPHCGSVLHDEKEDCFTCLAKWSSLMSN